MIQMFCDGVLLYDPRSADYIVAEPKCELEVNKTGNLTFRIAPTHPLYGQIQKLKSEIAVYQDNERLGAFRVLNVEQDFNNIKTVTCEGELAYLLDSVQRAAEYHDVTVAEYFAIVVANHNADVDSSKQFTVGAVTVTDPNDSLYRIHSYENTWECIEDKLLDRLGGYIRIRMSGSTRLIDYVTSYGNVNPQIIRFGENILDLVREVRGENVATVLVPLGAADEETGEKLTVKSVNDGLDYIEDAEAIETYGRIVKTVEYDDVTVASNLLTKGYAELAKMSKPTITLTMTAVDLHLVDVNIERIKIGDSIRVLSEPHGIDEYMIVQKLQLDFQHPENSVVTLGAVKQTLDGNVGKRKSEPLDAIIAQQAAMQQTISSVQTTVQECYSEISKTAEEIRTEVSESYLAKTELETIQRDFQTSITQSASEIRMDFTTITNEITNNVAANQQLLEEYIRFRGALIELGKIGNAFTAELSNEKLSFKENGQEIAFISNQALVITNAEIRNRLSLGTAERGWFDFIPRTTGNLSIQWRDPIT